LFAAYDPQQRRLAGSISADDSDALAPFDPKRG